MISMNTKFLIVGLGLIGGSYAKGLKKYGYFVQAIDINQASIQYAVENSMIDNSADIDDKTMIEQADIIIMGLYPNILIDWLKENQHYCKSNVIITDVSGVKTHIIEELSSFLRDDIEFIAAHPMAGKEVSGVQYSDETIFQSANLIITPTANNTKRAIDMVKGIGQILRFERVSILSPQRHDEMIGFLSQLTHVIAVCLMNTHQSDHLIAYTGDSFRDLTRIAKINEHLWSELFLLNKDILINEIECFIESMEDFRSALAEENVVRLKELFIQSTERRKAFDK